MRIRTALAAGAALLVLLVIFGPWVAILAGLVLVAVVVSRAGRGPRPSRGEVAMSHARAERDRRQAEAVHADRWARALGAMSAEADERARR